MSELTIFLHQPKAAGKTLEVMWPRYLGREGFCRISRLFPEASISDIRGYERLLREMPYEERQSIRFLTGHMYFGVHNAFDSTATYVTMLRDPIDRLISYYNYFLNAPETSLYRFIVQNKISFDRFVSFDENDIERTGVRELYYTLENGQSKLLAGVKDSSWVNEELFSVAERNISSMFRFVGITEMFDESLIQMGRLLAFRGPIYYRRLNVGAGMTRREIASDAEKTIRERNEVDYKIYEMYRTALEEQVRDETVFFSKALRRLRRNSAFYTKYTNVRRSVGKIKRAFVSRDTH